MTVESNSTRFDAFSESYEAALDQGLRLSGESSDYFAEARVAHLARRLDAAGARRVYVLDFGCGTGSTISHLLAIDGVEQVVATDESRELLATAEREHGSSAVTFRTLDEQVRDIDVAYCNGVFHHIDPPDRARAMRYVWDALRPGGYFSFWENNPLNPGTRLVMRRIPFDRDAATLTPRAARRLLTQSGFEITATDHLFFFPNQLRALRPLERHLRRVPLGGQYLVLARKPR